MALSSTLLAHQHPEMRASKQVWGKVFGTLDHAGETSRQALERAQQERARFKVNDSLECRNCHNYEFMDFTRQSVRAQNMRST